MRTSLSHPLQIAAVSPGNGHGRIGITFCPGKKQPGALTGAWDRDLGLDLDAVHAFGASALVTLIEDHEIDDLMVHGIGEETGRRHMDWLHLPIRDVSVPGTEFEQLWQAHGPGLRARVRDGFDVVVHCKGGLGRAGTIAARLLVELGLEPAQAIHEVRTARSGAIETRAQEEYVLSHRPVIEPAPSIEEDAIRDRAIGALIGLAAGDAVGTTLEFKRRDSYPRLTDMVGGGPFRLKPGQWTDDTSMALALADSLIENPDLDPADLMRRFVAWRDEGAYSCTGTCFDIGMTVSSALSRWQRSGDPLAGSTDPNSAGNGSLMRLSPVASVTGRTARSCVTSLRSKAGPPTLRLKRSAPALPKPNSLLMRLRGSCATRCWRQERPIASAGSPRLWGLVAWSIAPWHRFEWLCRPFAQGCAVVDRAYQRSPFGCIDGC